MKRSIINERKIIAILKEGEAGLSVEEICRKYSIGQSTYYKWRAKYGGMEISELKRLKGLEEENRRLKGLYAKVSLEKEILQEALEGKL
jgi:putative transposase